MTTLDDMIEVDGHGGELENHDTHEDDEHSEEGHEGGRSELSVRFTYEGICE
jgi:hypothetical protein